MVRQGSVGAFLRTVWHIFRAGGRAGLRAWRAGRELLPGVSYHFGRGPEPRRILASAPRLPRPDLSAGDLATMGILRDLAGLGYDVVLLPEDFTATEPFYRAVRELGVEVVARGASTRVPRSSSPARALLCGVLLYPAAAGGSVRAGTARGFPARTGHLSCPGPGVAARGSAARMRTPPRSAGAIRCHAGGRRRGGQPGGKTLVAEALPQATVELFPALDAPVPGNVPGFAERGTFFPRRFRPCPECRRGPLVRPGRLAATPRDCPRPVSASQGRRCRRKR